VQTVGQNVTLPRTPLTLSRGDAMQLLRLHIQIARLGRTLMPTFNGTNADDEPTGGNNDDVLNGRGGNDFIDGGLGNDQIRGGVGDDFLIV